MHQELQEALAALEQTESAVLFPTGYSANVGVISALCGEGDLILSDTANHASLIDGCRLSKAQRLIYAHTDIKLVASILQGQRNRFRRVFIVTDSVFSMDGDVAPLTQLCDLADTYDAILIVDEAHGTGVLGQHGGGLCDELDLKSRVPIRVGTLSKAVGALGGFVAGPESVIKLLINRARSLIYSTALPPLIADAALQGLTIIKAEPERRERLAQLSRLFVETIDGSWPIKNCVPHILPIVTGDPERTLQLAASLATRGFHVPAIRPPTVPQGKSRLRISLSSGHRQEDVIGLAMALRSLAD